MLQLNKNTLYKMYKSPYGKEIQEYRILDVLGKGGFSTVYRATCCRTLEEVAIKKLMKQTILEERLVERVSQEINIQSELDHPSILKLYTAFEDSEHIYIILELCSNGELLKYVSKHRDRSVLSEKEVRSVIKQIVDGLIYLHSNYILHRDIKLANVLLNEKMHIKIADFGLATKLLFPDEKHITMCGTPNYISPEVVSRKPHGLSTDLWSLGCLLYTLLVGKPPFETETVKSTLNRVLFDGYYMPAYLSQSAKDLISRLLQKDPRNRMSLREVSQHPFLKSDTSITESQNWIASDSGFDTGVVSVSNNISSKFHSLDRKQLSNNPNGYYMDTPKSSRRCKSQDRKSPEYNAEIVNMETSPENNFYSYDCVQNYPKKNRAFADEEEIYGKKYFKDTEFSPVNNKYNANMKGNCEVFYENEKQYQKDNKYLQCDHNSEKPNSQHNSDYRCRKEKNNDFLSKPLSNCSCQKSDHDFYKNYKPDTHTPARASTDTEFIEEMVKVVPFNTERLKATRHRAKNVILSILENGDVCVEFLRNKSKLREVVVEVCRITKNGMKMYIYYPNDGRGMPPSDNPPPMPLNGASAVFNCERLSKDNWKKYTYAARFVEMVQTKTPKLTLYTEKAKCVLMENKPDPDFEIIYYEGAKITKSRKGIKLTDNNGVISLLSDTGQDHKMDSSAKEHYAYYEKCFGYCRLLEEKLAATCTSSSETFFKVFPAIIGKKPVSKVKNSTWDGCTESPNLFHSTKYA